MRPIMKTEFTTPEIEELGIQRNRSKEWISRKDVLKTLCARGWQGNQVYFLSR